jgi:WD40 repeat protein
VSGDVSIWDVRTGTRVQHVRDAGEQVDRVAFSPDGQLLAVASRDGAEQIWHVKEKTLQSTGVRLQGSTLTLEFDSTSRFLLAAGGAGVITVADATIGMAVAKLEGAKGAIYSAHFGATSRYIVSASWDGTSRLWDAKPPYRSWAAAAVSDDCGSVGGVNPDGRFIAIGCRDLPTRVWDTAEDRLVAELPSVTHVEGDYLSAYPVVSTDGNLAAIARGNRVELYEVPGARLVRTVVHEASVSSVAFAPSGHTIISGSIDGGLLITRENQSSMRVRGYAGAIDVAILIPDGQVAVSDALRRLRIYSADGLVTNGDAELETRARALRVSADAKRLVVVPRAGAPSRAPELWDLVRHQRVSLLSGHVGDVWTARFARDVLLTAGADGSVRMWDSSTGELLHTYQAASRTMFDATLDPDGEFVVAGGGDGVIRFWDRQSGRMVWQLSAHRSTVAGLHFEDRELITRGFGGDISRWTLPPARSVISEWNRR